MKTILLLILTLAWGVMGATYYIDYEDGSDANNGTSKATPWKHAPGMLGTTDSVLAYETTHSSSSNTDVAGDRFIFKGGVTWSNDCFVWLWRNGGGTGWTVGVDAVYFGVDKTWYTGSAWSRPIFDAQETDVTANSKGSPPSDNAMFRIYKATDGYFIVDNLEFKGMYHFDNNDDAMLRIAAEIAEVKNCYFHGWGHGAVENTGPCNDMGDGKTYEVCNRWVSGLNSGEYANASFRAIATPYDNDNVDIRVHHCYIDGSDSYPTSGNMACATKGRIKHFYCNYIAYVQNAITNHFCEYVWGNTFEEIATVTDFVSSNHHNLYQACDGGIDKVSYVYNNIVKNVAGGATFLWYPKNNTKFYCFNNVVYGDNNQTFQLSSLGLSSESNTAGFYIWNNTIQMTNTVSPINGSQSGYPVSVFSIKNNHFIASNPELNPRIDSVVLDSITNLKQTNEMAILAGYTTSSTYPYAPQGEDAPTTGSGTDLSAICSGLYDSDPSYPSNACRYDATLGVELDTINHTISYPKKTPLLRGFVLDIGAYEYNTKVKNIIIYK